MAKTSQAAEPTMEEILASIRQIISDDEKTSQTKTDPDPAQESIDTPEPLEAAPQAEVEDAQDDVLDLTDVVEPVAAPQATEPPNAAPPVVAPPVAEPVLAEPETENQAMPDDLELAQADDDIEPAGEILRADRGIVGENTQDAAMAAFSSLAETLMTSDGTSRTLEDLVIDMLRPMLKSWLDDNLPPLVERMVQDEIERIARGRR